MMDVYELIRRLNFSPTTSQWSEPEVQGGAPQTNTYWNLSGETGWDDFGQFQSKYNEVIDNGDGTFGVIFQNPTQGKNHKYDTMVGTYKLDPATGQYVMQGDPVERRETSSMNQFQDFAEKGGLVVGGVLGAGYGLQGLGVGQGMTAAQAAAMNPEMYGLAAQTGLGGGAAAGGGLLGVDAAMADLAASGAAGMGGAGAAAGGAASGAGGTGLLGALGSAASSAAGAIPWKNIIGAGLGAYTSQDQEQKTTSEREPWGPAQGWIKDNMTVGRGLQQQYMDQPFSPAQQQAYQGLFNTINAGNQLAPGLLSNANAMMQGYDRHADKTTRARPKLNPLTASWAPGLLNFGG